MSATDNDPLPTTDHTPDPGHTAPYPAATPDAAALPVVAGYEILGVLGRGGMGVVYKARHLGLKRVVALKMILAGGHAGPQELARFRLEAEAAARLQHQGIVQVFEAGEADGHPYCALEFVAGDSLAGKLDGGPLPAREAARLVEALARAVQFAHSRNVVHRDLKPANVLLAEDGTPKVADFGLARHLDADSGATQAGAIMGTPSYMAPEQASGRSNEAGPAADVYALGAILYECLTGHPPFRGATVVETLDQVRTREPVPPSRLRRGVPRDLETIALKCLAKEPEKRYASAEGLGEDLRRWQAGEPIAARPVGRVERAVKWVRRNPVVAGAALAAVLALAAGATVSTLKYLDAEHQRGLAEARRKDADEQKTRAQDRERDALREADKARQARDFLVSIFRIVETDVQGGNVTARQILAAAEQRIPVEFATQPELRADLVAAVGEVKRSLARMVPQAMILEVRGAVRVRSAAGRDKPAVPQALLHLDDRVTVPAGATLQLVFLSDLHKERLAPGREATVGTASCAPADAVRERDDSVMMTFVRMPRGTFYRSSSDSNRGDAPRKGVQWRIPEDFEIAVHLVTQGQWQAVMGDNPSAFSRGGAGSPAVASVTDEELKLFPVENVSWDHAQFFIRKLNERERGRGYRYRLPTAAEWEYACRAGATTEQECLFNFYLDRPTNDLSSRQANFNGTMPAGNGQPGPYLQRTSRVGAYPPNRLGLCDMHGNVWQYCSDAIPPNSPSPLRANRGGCWMLGGSWCAAGVGGTFPQTDADFTRGFRLVRESLR